MNRTLGIVFSLFTLVGSSAVALANEGAADPGCADKRAARHEKKLERFDLNKDGKLDDSERAAMKEAFAKRRMEAVARYDLNKDGKLDDSERAAMRKDFVGKMFGRLDTDGNGQISAEEARCTRLARRFEQIDTDRSGSLSVDEVIAAGPMMGGHHHGQHAAWKAKNVKKSAV